ncbi:MAG: hypothetical protein BWY65_02104 [Firmicutes bacterium ADurb.Bin373]|nr:MAG: hypothetical protein BWY65_02104 [Firmicutes bacterium ADurb.Bin373]
MGIIQSKEKIARKCVHQKTAAAVPMTSAGLLTNKPESVPASGAGQSAPLPGCNAW